MPVRNDKDDFNAETWQGHIQKGERVVNGPCIARFAFATNGTQGGDWGHGSRLKIEFEALGGPIIELRQTGKKDCEKIEILVGGDWELHAFAEGLEYLARSIKASFDK